MAIKASGLDYKEFAAYLVDGVTWGRLRAIATQAPEEGGLGLCADGSRKCKEIFSASPSAIIKNRPETDHTFLEFLKGKEHTLHLIAERDLQQRPSLGPEASKAALSLGDIGLRIFRTVMCGVIHRCLFLHYWASKHARVAAVRSWDELLEEAKEHIFDLALTTEVLQRFKLKPEGLESMANPPRTWVEMAVMHVVGQGEEALVAMRLQSAFDFHRKYRQRLFTLSPSRREHIQNSVDGSKAPLQGPSCSTGSSRGRG